MKNTDSLRNSVNTSGSEAAAAVSDGSRVLTGNEESIRRTKCIVMTGMLGAISFILMLFEFPVFFVPGFIKLDLSELPIMIGGFLMGPVWGSAVAVIKIVLKLIFKGTTTGFVGELANLVGSLCYLLPASIIYMKKKTKKHAAIGMAIGTLVTSIAMVLCNTFVTFPLYMKLYEMDEAMIIGMTQAVNPLCNNMLTVMMFSIFPFNLLKYGVVSVITLLVYKRISKAVRL